ncbi:acetate--CoA ligase [Sporosarcina sp. Marseille-Q4063]|uniref:acetate--CoA ligase n=1 Tax=Sporosarcina sp. Marseille-Q4063 TaxID=2810514 RepID=UPI001BB0D117|nr:acetate--CoA ligase [Sporosarcina sp. Marseille-Q4063]QUW22734.1 acetate--CoA ligase [Sporosarcina sp. Marseille-Q4063]
MKTLPVIKGDYQLKHYNQTTAEFNWIDAEKVFSWHESGKINIAYEAIDRHAASYRKNKVALYYKDSQRKESYTYFEMKKMTNKTANLFRNQSSLTKGDRLFVFMPRSPELYFSVFGALKLGVIVGPLFDVFKEDAVYERLLDSEAKAIVTTSELLNQIPVHKLPHLESIFVVGEDIKEDEKTIDFLKHLKASSSKFQLTWLTKEDATLLHYTEGTMGKPNGIVLTQKAMVQQLQTTRWVLDLTDEDIYWCTADPGWVAGTVYGMFGPMLAGATIVVLGDKFSPEGWYNVIEEYSVTVWYSAPTAFRMLMGAGENQLRKHDLGSLRHILSVGEPLNPEIIQWGIDSFNLRIHDTWWTTETGAQMIANFQCLPIKFGSMGKAVPGVEIAIIDHQGNKLPSNEMGNLAIKKGWPAMMHGIWNNKEAFDSSFINDEWYITGDSAFMDEDGYFWFQGRVDDVIMTSGERVGPFDVEAKLLEHEAIEEAGVIGIPDPVEGEVIKAYIVLKERFDPSSELEEDIKSFVRKGLAAYASPKEIEFKDKLPKTRSGKIMRSVLKSWELNA